MPWDDRYSLRIPLVDGQHKQLVRLVNGLHDACRAGSSNAEEAFRASVGEIVNYVKKHFHTEERIMERIGYPGLAEHRYEHRQFVARFLLDVRHFEEGRPFVARGFATFLRDWILSHIACTDKIMGAYVIKQVRENPILVAPKNIVIPDLGLSVPGGGAPVREGERPDLPAAGSDLDAARPIR